MSREPAEKKTVFKDLVDKASLAGTLSSREILDAFEEVDVDPDELDRLYETLEKNAVEIIDDVLIEDLGEIEVEFIARPEEQTAEIPAGEYKILFEQERRVLNESSKRC